MGITRPNADSRHSAGFHRFPELEPLHQALETNVVIQAALANFYLPHETVAIGLCDITINRSQDWHTDLLRGKYARFLSPGICWSAKTTSCVKALLYLQDSRSLKVVPGSHLRPVSLVNDGACIPARNANVTSVAVKSGDIVLMDIRTVHRGSTEAEMAKVAAGDAPRILVSTVFGARGAELTRAMQTGNTHRLRDWDARHLPGCVSV